MSTSRPLTSLVWRTQLLRLKLTSARKSQNCQNVQIKRNQSSSVISTKTNPITESQSDSQNKVEKNELKLDDDLIRHLERTSLVDFESEEALVRLKEAIQFANTILSVNTEGIEPMTSVLEDTPLRLREDKAVKMSREDILCNASVTEEDYFVSPPGNIPLEPKTKKFTQDSNSNDVS